MIRREILKLGCAVFLLGATSGLSAASLRMLVTPPLPAPGTLLAFSVDDPAPAYPNAVPILRVTELAPAPAGVVRTATGVRAATANWIDIIHGLPAGQYVAQYFDLPDPSALNDGSVPKASFTFFVSSKGPVQVVEYFNAAIGRYFITADEAEIAALDSGHIPGWQRTGQSFHALPADQTPSNGGVACRFYGLPEYGLDSHFFSDSPEECVAVAAQWSERWLLENPAAFGTLGDIAPFECDDTMQKLYRLYSNRQGADHRYTTSESIRDAMVAQGWTVEAGLVGDPSDPPFSMCVLR